MQRAILPGTSLQPKQATQSCRPAARLPLSTAATCSLQHSVQRRLVALPALPLQPCQVCVRCGEDPLMAHRAYAFSFSYRHVFGCVAAASSATREAVHRDACSSWCGPSSS